MRSPCAICGTEILEATAARTGGLCMPCFKDPEAARKAQQPKPSLEQCLVDLQNSIVASLTSAAERALVEFPPGEIFGFYLYHGHFGYAVATVLTESGFVSVLEDSGYDPTSAAARQVRWSSSDAPHGEYASDLCGPVDAAFNELFAYRDTPGLSDVVEEIFINVVKYLRQTDLFSDQVLLSVQEGDESKEAKVAYAELFTTGPGLDLFIADLSPLDPESLARNRERLARFHR